MNKNTSKIKKSDKGGLGLKTSDRILIYTDGGARGNPGEAAIGVLVNGKGYGEGIGIATNNVAEYKAVIFALKKAKQLYGKDAVKKNKVEVRMDSELVVRQLRHEYKIESEELQPLFIQIWNLLFDFGAVDFRHVPREENSAADKIVNEVLDGNWR